MENVVRIRGVNDHPMHGELRGERPAAEDSRGQATAPPAG